MYYDGHNNSTEVISLAPLARTATANGTGVDLQGYQSCEFYVITGTMTDGAHTINLQESDDNSTYTSIADADILGIEPALVLTDDNVIKKAGYLGRKRYVRVITTVSGATTGGVYCAIVQRGRPFTRPQ